MQSWPQRVLIFGAALMLASAAVVAFAVIPAVRTDTFPLAAPGRAVVAFWCNVLLAVLAAVMAIASSGVRPRRALSGIAAALALLLGLALIDAAAALSAHGPAMHTAVVALWTCVGLDLVGGALMVSAALKRWRDQA